MIPRAAVLTAALLVVSLVVPAAAVAADGTQAGVSAVGDSPAVAQTANNSSGPSAWEPPGPFTLEELRANGQHPAEAPPSVRYLGGTSPSGAVALRYRPADPLSNEPQFLTPSTELQGDVLEIYSTIFGGATGEYTFAVVFWQEGEKTVNGTTVSYAADQQIQRVTVDLEDGYASTDVQLNSHYQETWQATAWIEEDGEPVDGVRWRFAHASLPASQQVQIQTRADAWWYAFRTAIIPGAAGIIVGLTAAQLTLRRTGRGPGYGLSAWALFGGIAVLSALGGLYYEVAAVVANFEIILGLSLGIVAYGGGLRMHPPKEIVRFARKELQEARSLRNPDAGSDPDARTDGGATDFIEIPADGYRDELYEDEVSLTTVRTDEGDRVVTKKGIRPFFARLFADAARVNLGTVQTRVKVRDGAAAEKVFLDPESDGVKHRAARLVRRMPVWHRLPEPDEDEQIDTATKALYGLLTVAALSLPYLGYQIGLATINAPLVGAGIGMVLLALESYAAVDAEINFTPAPRHFVSADASLTVLQSEYADAKTVEEYEEIAWAERSRTALEAREVEARRDASITQRMAEDALGMDLDILGGTDEPFEGADDEQDEQGSAPSGVADDD